MSYLKEICAGHTYREIIELLRIKFNISINIIQLKYKMKKLKLHSNTRNFIKGHKVNEKPIGTEVFKKGNGNNCWFIKIAENTWIRKHYYIYEKHYGKVPKSCVIVFADGNRDNF